MTDITILLYMFIVNISSIYFVATFVGKYVRPKWLSIAIAAFYGYYAGAFALKILYTMFTT